MSELRFVVPGAPVPCARVRVSKTGHARTPDRTKAYANLVGIYANQAMARTRWIVGGRGPFAVIIAVHREAERGDPDNMAKSILDACTKARVWSDDARVHDLHVRMFVDRERPRAEVCVTLVSP